MTSEISKARLWAGRVMSTLVVLFLLFDGGMKALSLAAAIEGTAKLGYPVRIIPAIGIAELICVVLYVIPRTSILGAILLMGYLGGATATQVRIEDPWFIFPVIIGALVWGGLYLRDREVRGMIPVRKG